MQATNAEAPAESFGRSLVALVVAVLACLGIGGAGSALTNVSVKTWYPTLTKPSWNPPDAAFPIVWTTLFVMMGISAWLVWRRRRLVRVDRALILFAVQLALNIAWSALFFTLRNPGLAFAEILMLWVMIAATAAAFFKVSRLAGWLLVPYLAWVGFAAVLNFTIWRLNS
ncbi:hypothetical protein ABI59_21665 [Acidobacteria bacterium Mor1]|nr:hypothetical protein ABI59_21665 [Acidobacteria bacterium Mor1]